MKRKNLVLGIVATALVIGVAAFSAAPTLAHGTQGYGGYGGQMGHGYSQGMMGSQGHGYGMMGSQGHGQGMMGSQGHGQGMMGSQGHGQGMMGSGNAPCGQVEQSGVDRNLGVDDVKGIIESRLKMHNNDRLKVGKVEASGDNTIVAEIVTVDDSLVHKIEFDTKTGAHHPIK
ncbi:MAG: hypothetical protein HQ513_19590 [Rhodospirillales bacterium]|nr:hypothetical protein [Rhodospirillales bacterium]